MSQLIHEISINFLFHKQEADVTESIHDVKLVNLVLYFTCVFFPMNIVAARGRASSNRAS